MRAAGFRSCPAPSTASRSTRAGIRCDRAAQLFQRAEGVARAVDEQRGRAPFREKTGAQLIRLPRRMQRIGKQQQPVGQPGTLGRDHRGLPAAVGMPAGEHAPLRPLPQRLHRPGHAFAIARLRRGRRRLSRPPRETADRSAAPAGPLRKRPATGSPAAARWHSTPLRGSAPAHRRLRCSGVCSTPRRSSASKTCSILMYSNSIAG